MTPFNFHPEARLEYLAAAEYYAERRAALGLRFTIEVEATIARILEAPAAWPILAGQVRRCITHRFPFGILYSVETGSILIVAVMHCSRKPGYWKDRLKE